MTSLRAVAPAKLNLALAVTGRRRDGYHTLRSVFVRLALHDELELELREDPRDEDSLVLVGDLDGPVEDNLVLRAVAELRRTIGQRLPALRLRLTKRIPTGAGLAGGSSDAAAVLDLAMRAWGVRLHPAERLAVALRLGADVPFFAVGHPAALIQGIGEGLEPLPAPRPGAGIVLVTPAERLATTAVFAELDREWAGPNAGDQAAAGPNAGDQAAEGVTSDQAAAGDTSDQAAAGDASDQAAAGDASDRVDRLAAALREGLDASALAALAPLLRGANDLWPPARRLSPRLGVAREALEHALDRPVMMTGSGSTLFAIYPSAEAAADAADGLHVARPGAIRDARIDATTTGTEQGDDG